MLLRIAAGLMLLSTCAVSKAATCAGADLILRNGKIVTMDDRGTVVQALAARDGRIVATGTVRQLSRCAAPDARIVDLRGRTVLPGLIDVHTHAMEWAKSIVRGEINAGDRDIKSIADITARVKQRVGQIKPGEWVVGFAWDDARLVERRYITRADLDAVAPKNPVYLMHISGHLSVANTAALKIGGVTRESADPQGGLIERDQSGEPTGILKDTAMPLVARHLPPDAPDLPARAARLVSEEALKYGLTTIHDIWLAPEEMRGYQQADRQGWLNLRVHMAPGVRNVDDAEQLIKTGVYSGFGNDRLKFGPVKIFTDGGMAARTIAIYPPGVLGEPDNIGLLLWKNEDLQKAHLMLARHGWQLATHAIGDRAMDQVMDSYALVMKELGLKQPRFRIIHAGISTPAIQKRMKELDVLVDGNPPFIYWIGSWFRKYGPERVRWSYPAKSYLDNGIIQGAASDVGVTPISPWWGIWSAVVRREMQTNEVLAPEERLTVNEALRLYTRNGAYIGMEERDKGSLETGKLADFIIVDRDVLTVPSDELKDVHVLQSYVGGRLVYDSAAPASSGQ